MSALPSEFDAQYAVESLGDASHDRQTYRLEGTIGYGATAGRPAIPLIRIAELVTPFGIVIRLLVAGILLVPVLLGFAGDASLRHDARSATVSSSTVAFEAAV